MGTHTTSPDWDEAFGYAYANIAASDGSLW